MPLRRTWSGAGATERANCSESRSRDRERADSHPCTQANAPAPLAASRILGCDKLDTKSLVTVDILFGSSRLAVIHSFNQLSLESVSAQSGPDGNQIGGFRVPEQ